MPDNGEWQRTAESPEREARRMEALGVERQATEKTLQSIDATLKRIEVILQTGTKSRSCV